jgi:hypothetical protein
MDAAEMAVIIAAKVAMMVNFILRRGVVELEIRI